jgi:hypothetical protein
MIFVLHKFRIYGYRSDIYFHVTLNLTGFRMLPSTTEPLPPILKGMTSYQVDCGEVTSFAYAKTSDCDQFLPIPSSACSILDPLRSSSTHNLTEGYRRFSNPTVFLDRFITVLIMTEEAMLTRNSGFWDLAGT